MDQLAPRLIRRASKREYAAIIIDPIYKVLTGDENAADKMAHFCNQFDRVCHELGAAVIYCHHHSKGSQGDKRSMDRASGSGVFGRDPDALLDMIELWVPDDLRKQQENTAICRLLTEEMDKRSDLWRGGISQDDLQSSSQLQFLAMEAIQDYNQAIMPLIARERRRVSQKTAWRIEPTLREFPPHDPIDCWFEHPIHTLDAEGVLQDAQPEEAEVPWKKGAQGAKRSAGSRRADREKKLQVAWDMLQKDEAATVQGVANYADVSPRTIRNWVAEFGGYVIDGCEIRKEDEKG